MTRLETVDVLVVGAGAAGLAAAIFAARAHPSLTIRCVDGARHIGAKILVSGGSRCNVTNRSVTAADFWGGSSRAVTHVLRAFSAHRAAAFFEEIGVALHEEEDGKLFPDTGRSRSVLDALLRELETARTAIDASTRIARIVRDEDGFLVTSTGGVAYRARRVVLATGGRSLPKTGSDGGGYELARALGHGYIETTPALAPLLLDGGLHVSLSGVTHAATLTLKQEGAPRVALTGSLLWTHFGFSGPVVLNLSRHWHRAMRESRHPAVFLSVLPDETFELLDRWLLDQQAARPRALVQTVIGTRLPTALADAWVSQSIGSDVTMSHFTKAQRRRLLQALLESPVRVRDSRGYNYAEVTAGGIPLDEVDPATMQSRVCPGLYLVGEVLDVDGRLGGFNFQWAWSSGWVAGHAIAKALGTSVQTTEEGSIRV